jgi:hypothetical protein
MQHTAEYYHAYNTTTSAVAVSVSHMSLLCVLCVFCMVFNFACVSIYVCALLQYGVEEDLYILGWITT